MYKDTLRLFWQVTWRYKWLLIMALFGMAGFVISIDIVTPYIVSLVINKLSAGDLHAQQFASYEPYLYTFIAFQLVHTIFGRINIQAFIRLEPNAIRDLENLSFQKLLGHSMAFYADNFSGALVAKVNRLTSSYQRFLETTSADVFNFMVRYITTLGIMFFLSPTIALVFLGWSILFCGSLIILHRNKLKYSKAAASSQTRVTARLADIITNTLTIRSFSRGSEEKTHFHTLTQERRDLRFRSYLVADYIRIYKSLAMVVLDSAVLILSVKFALNGTLALGSIVLIQFYMLRLSMQLWDFGRFIDRIEESLADSAEMTEVMMLPHEVVDIPHPEAINMPNGKIEFRAVHFQYPESKGHGELFENFNLTIEAGQKVGLVGPSGGGKTTFTKLLLRFMDIQEGQVLIDDQNIAKVSQEDLRRTIAYVPQEPLLFHRSILENIAYGKPNASLEDVQTAAIGAHADEFVQQLPRKYDTIVGERGVKLSGGQRQRVALARAMLKEAPIIILDEATSSLDSVSERLITEALDKLMEKRTTLVIAHRLSTIRKLDRILVLSDGKVVEDGSHDELLKKNGLYAKLWAHQSGDFIGED